MRQSPNIVITGTPGVGKTTHCESLAAKLNLRHISVNQVVKDKGCHEGWSEEYQSWIVDEDKVRMNTAPCALGVCSRFTESCLMPLRTMFSPAVV